MSHVDEGTLHAYLDGELTAVERERVEAHLQGCAACQARLAEERAIVERASRLLGMATPPERAVPPLAQLRQRRLPWWRVRQPLAWAATLIMAVGLGWFAGMFQGRRMAETAAFDSQPAALARVEHALRTPPAATSSVDRLQQDEASPSGDREADRRLAAARPAAQAPNNALATRQSASAAEERDSTRRDSAKLGDVAALSSNAPAAVYGGPGVSVRGSRPPAASAAPPPAAPEPQAKAAPVTMGEATSGVITIDGAQVRRQRAPAILSSEWPLIARQPARDVLGVEPVVIPGFAVRAYRRNPAAREIVVEQVTDAGTTISLIERRLETVDFRADSVRPRAYADVAKSVNERLARFVGPLRVEIDGPLTPDSLSSLLDLAR